MSDSKLTDGFSGQFPIKQINMPLRSRNVIGIVRREAERRSIGVQFAEHVHQRVASL